MSLRIWLMMPVLFTAIFLMQLLKPPSSTCEHFVWCLKNYMSFTNHFCTLGFGGEILSLQREKIYIFGRSFNQCNKIILFFSPTSDSKSVNFFHGPGIGSHVSRWKLSCNFKYLYSGVHTDFDVLFSLIFHSCSVVSVVNSVNTCRLILHLSLTQTLPDVKHASGLSEIQSQPGEI